MTEPFEEQLLADRPPPPAGFRGELRRVLLAQRPGVHRPPNLWTMVGVSAAIGIVLLIVALILAT